MVAFDSGKIFIFLISSYGKQRVELESMKVQKKFSKTSICLDYNTMKRERNT
jgi:hypothetical protein